jgi:hypothetical protein
MRYTPPQGRHRVHVVAGVLFNGEPYAFVIEDSDGCPDCGELFGHDGGNHEKRNGPGVQPEAVQVPPCRTQEKHHDCPPT